MNNPSRKPINIGELIETRRTELHMKQEALAEEMGVKQSTVSRWERGARRVRKGARKKLEAVLQMPAGALS